jgi:hypothetical protein
MPRGEPGCEPHPAPPTGKTLLGRPPTSLSVWRSGAPSAWAFFPPSPQNGSHAGAVHRAGYGGRPKPPSATRRATGSRTTRATSGWERSRRSWTAACCASSPAGSAPAEVRGQIIPASPCVGAGLLPPLALPTLPPVRQLEEVPAAAFVGHDHNDIERPCVGRGIIDVYTRSIRIIEFSANQATRQHSAPAVARHHRALVGGTTTTLDDRGVVHELAATSPGSGADASADK